MIIALLIKLSPKLLRFGRKQAKTLPEGHKILPPNILVIRVPNVGKSTLINKLSGRKAKCC